MPTYTTRMKLIRPATSEHADVATIIANWDKLDNTSGLILCTEATKPVTNLFPGMYIKCTDSGKHYLYGGGSWTLDVYSGGTWDEDFYSVLAVYTFTGSGSVFYGAQLSRPYQVGLTNGDTNTKVDVASNTTIRIDQTDSGSSAGRGLNVPFSLGATTQVAVKLDAVAAMRATAASIGARPVALNKSSLNSVTTANAAKYGRVRFDLWDGGVYKCTMGYIGPKEHGTTDGPFTYDDFLTIEKVLSLASGSHTLQIVAVTEGATTAATDVLSTTPVIMEANLKVTLSA